MGAAITFNEIPADIRAPGTLVEFDSSRAQSGPQIKPIKVLLAGQRLSTGTVAQLVPKFLQSQDQARGYFGPGSMLHNMAERLFQNDHEIDVTAIALDDNGAGVAASLAITVTASAVQAGTIALMIGGRRVLVKVAAGDAQNTIAANINAAIAAVDGMPVTAGVSTNVVTLTARHKGTEGNQIDVRVNYYDGEALPSGVTLSNVPGTLSGGTTNPSVASNLWAAIGDIHYDVMILPWTDSANLTAIDAELASRWGPKRQIEGIAYCAKSDTLANLSTFGATSNSKHVSPIGAKGLPTPPWEVAAAYGAVASYYLRNDPARGLRGLILRGVLAPKIGDRFTWDERDLQLRNGVSSLTIDADGTVRIDRAITMYKTSSAGAPDIAYLDVSTPATLGYIRWDYRRRWATKYPRHKIAQDGTRFGSGQPVVTPQVANAEAIAAYEQWMEMGLVDDFEGFKRDLSCVINASDPTRLDQRLVPRLMNPFYTLASQVQFIL